MERLKHMKETLIGCVQSQLSDIHNVDTHELGEAIDMKKVLCHELTHAAMFSYGIELSIEQEELLADLIATYGQEIINMTNSIFNRLKKDGELK